jgi:hypothetical protein
VYDTPATNRIVTLKGVVYEAPGIQVRVRGLPDSQDAPRSLLLAITKYLLEEAPGLVVDLATAQYTIVMVNRTDDILPLQQDDHGRWEWVLNAAVRLSLNPEE